MRVEEVGEGDERIGSWANGSALLLLATVGTTVGGRSFLARVLVGIPVLTT